MKNLPRFSKRTISTACTLALSCGISLGCDPETRRVVERRGELDQTESESEPARGGPSYAINGALDESVALPERMEMYFVWICESTVKLTSVGAIDHAFSYAVPLDPADDCAFSVTSARLEGDELVISERSVSYGMLLGLTPEDAAKAEDGSIRFGAITYATTNGQIVLVADDAPTGLPPLPSTVDLSALNATAAGLLINDLEVGANLLIRDEAAIACWQADDAAASNCSNELEASCAGLDGDAATACFADGACESTVPDCGVPQQLVNEGTTLQVIINLPE